MTRGALRRLGTPDLRLRLGSSCFPVHKRLVTARSGVLANLIDDFDGQSELGLPGLDGSAGGSPSEVVGKEEHFQLFLAQLYNGGGAIDTEDQALALVILADFYDCPCVLPAADSFLALSVLNGLSAKPKSRLVPALPEGSLVAYLELASAHKLRR